MQAVTRPTPTCHPPLHQKQVTTARIAIPVAGLGTFKMTQENIVKASRHQFRLIDTAKAYGNEHEIGTALRSYYPKPIVITKLFEKNVMSEQAMREAVNDSTQKLGQAPDLVLVHAPYFRVNMKVVFQELEKMKNEGLFKEYGSSNFDLDQMKYLVNELMITPALNQVEYHVDYQRRELLEFCKQHSIVVQAYRPLAGGKLWGNESAEKKERMAKLEKIAAHYNCGVPELLYTWIAQEGMAMVAKVSSEEHQKEYLNSGRFEIGKEDLEEIRRMNRGEAGRTCTRDDWTVPFTNEVKATWSKL